MRGPKFLQFAQFESDCLIRVISEFEFNLIYGVRSPLYGLIYYYLSQEKWLKSLTQLNSLELLVSHCNHFTYLLLQLICRVIALRVSGLDRVSRVPLIHLHRPLHLMKWRRKVKCINFFLLKR